MTDTCDWIGASGMRYTHWIYALPANLNAGQNGNYVFAKVVNNQWGPIYIGQGDLGDRLDNHHQAACIRSKGATHFHAHKNESEKARRAEEQDLLANYTMAYSPTGCNLKLGG